MRHRITAVLLVLLLAGCAPSGQGAGRTTLERPPAPLDSMPLASDARIDSLGYLAGSFVGEGTSREVHLISSDTGFIVALVRRYRPDLLGDDPLWTTLRNLDAVPLTQPQRRRTVAGRGPRIGRATVGSPLGHTEVAVSGVFVRGGRCGPRGARAELIVEDAPLPGEPALRGPVLGTLLAPEEPARRERGLVRRPDPPAPSAALVDRLIDRTSYDLDSTLAATYPGLELRPLQSTRVEVNTLADIDAADVIAFRAGGDLIRYAVSLRERRVVRGRDTLVATAVMVWDSAGSWRQAIFRPTLLQSVAGRLDALGAVGRPIYWRRLQPISDVAYSRDNIWMEQVNVRNGRVVWGIIQPRGNVVVAAAEVEGVC